MKNNNFYSVEDFVATIKRVEIERGDIEKVIGSWGHTNGKSKKESGSELQFGAVLKLKSGRYAYVEGSNDYTGWGCQDSASLHTYDWLSAPYEKEPEIQLLLKSFLENEYSGIDQIEWEKQPEDLNRWVRGELKIDEEYL